MTGAVSPHPFRSGQICVTQTMNPPVYQLPQGLSPGVRVRTLVYDYGFWTVMEIDRQEVQWRVFVVLLLVEIPGARPVSNRKRPLIPTGL
jgi:hypothetical protein